MVTAAPSKQKAALRGGEGPARRRLLVALDMPVPVVEDIATWQALAMPAGCGIEPVPADALVIAVSMIGPVGVDGEAAAIRVVRELDLPVTRVWLERQAVAVSAAAGRGLYLLPVRSPGLVPFKGALEEGLAARGVPVARRRMPRPHLTVGRTEPATANAGEDPVAFAQSFPEAPEQSFDCVRAGVYRFESGPRGPEHVPLAQVELSLRTAVR